MDFPPMTPTGLKTVAQAEAAVAELEQIPAVRIANTLKIQTKAAEIIPLECNAVQAKLERVIAKQKALGKPVRVIALKARQVGVSTWVAGRYYDDVTRTPNLFALIVAHEDDSTRKIFEKTKLMQDENPQAPPTKNSNRKELIFLEPLRSTISIQTAGKPEVGRSLTIHRLHCSEVAFWGQAQKSLTALLQAVPDSPDTWIVLESTANGVGNEFHRRWLRAVNPKIQSDWVAFFFGWWEEPKYSRPAGRDFKPDAEEAELKKRYKLTDDQLAWRRWAIEDKCGGDKNLFKQEYPACPEEAFLASGLPVFDMDVLQEMLDRAEEPKAVGELVEDESTGEIRFMETPAGRLKVWRFPHKAGQYAIGVDVAEGIRDQDGAGAVVLHKRALTECARLHGCIPPDDLAREAYKLQRWYNWAPVCPDATGVGQAFVNAFKQFPGARIYRKRIRDKITNEMRDQLGYKISSHDARTLLIQQYAAAIRAREVPIRDADAIREHMSFVYHEKTRRPDHQEGCHDDRVFENMLAFEMIRAEPWYRVRPAGAKPKHPRRGASVPGPVGA